MYGDIVPVVKVQLLKQKYPVINLPKTLYEAIGSPKEFEVKLEVINGKMSVVLIPTDDKEQ